MRHVRKSVLLWYTPREMYDLVTDVPAYPQFLPWCSAAEIVARHDDGVTARLGLAFKGVRQSFTTRNREEPGRSVAMKLVEGPFSKLEGHWRFEALGSGGDASGACKVEFDLRWAFSNRALGLLISPAFDRIAETFVESFVQRAEELHGAR